MNQSPILAGAAAVAAMAMMAAQRPLVRSVRAAVCDNMMTYDSAHQVIDSAGGGTPVYPGKSLCYGAGGGYGRGGVMAHDGRTYDSTGAFLVGELERMDQTLHEPLASYLWGRDIDVREDVTIADEVSSFTLSTYGSAGGLGAGNGIGNGKAWIGKNTDQMTGVGVDIAKIPHPLTLWGQELKYTIPEIESSAKLGRPIDQQKYAGMQMKYNMDVDEQVYFGDTNISATGLVNNTLVTNVSNVANGVSGSPLWAQKTPDEILADFNTALTSVWAASAWAVMPQRILLPPTQFGYISTAKVSQAGNVSILKYVLENNITKTSGGGNLEILPSKWCVGTGVGGTVGTENGHNRMSVYTKDRNYVRFPMTLLQRTPIQFMSIYHMTTYFCRLGQVEVVYPETLGYFDGIG